MNLGNILFFIKETCVLVESYNLRIDLFKSLITEKIINLQLSVDGSDLFHQLKQIEELQNRSADAVPFYPSWLTNVPKEQIEADRLFFKEHDYSAALPLYSIAIDIWINVMTPPPGHTQDFKTIVHYTVAFNAEKSAMCNESMGNDLLEIHDKLYINYYISAKDGWETAINVHKSNPKSSPEIICAAKIECVRLWSLVHLDNYSWPPISQGELIKYAENTLAEAKGLNEHPDIGIDRAYGNKEGVVCKNR